MLVESAVLKSRLQNNENFELYTSLVDSFVDYLRVTEGLSVTQDSAELMDVARSSFAAMPEALQQAKLANFLSYYDHCAALVAEGYSLKDKRASLSKFVFVHGLVIPSAEEIYEMLDHDVYAEIYDKNFLQSYRSPGWLETTSYGLRTLETQDWRNLFSRSEEILAKQMQIAQAIYGNQISQPIHRPIGVHTVKELKGLSPYCCEIESLVYSPVYSAAGEFVGALHLMELHDLRQLNFTVYSESNP